MKQVLVLGAGKSAPYLIARLLDFATPEDWHVVVGDLDVAAAAARVGGHDRGEAVPFDVHDTEARARLIDAADLVVNFLAPAFQGVIARDCVARNTPMVSASYRSPELLALDAEARERGVLVLSEMGLDPGIDNMSAAEIFDRVRADGGRIAAYRSYGSGVPSNDQPHTPLRYVITWNPRNVVMAGEAGAQYLQDGLIRMVPYRRVFERTWPVQVDGVGVMEAYPNRDSLSYIDVFGLQDAHTMIRGTLRYPGWSEFWGAMVALGLPDERLRIPDLAERSFAEVTEMFLPAGDAGPALEQRVARHLGVSPTGTVIDKMRWLGLFDHEPTGCRGDTSAVMLAELLERKLPLEPEHRDMVILQHDIEVLYEERPARHIVSTLVARGEPGGFTAMSKTVGGPAALGARMILRGELDLAGCRIPTEPAIYEPVLAALADEGVAFAETVSEL